MKVTTDAFFSIGKTHTVCQDYAVARQTEVCVSDGCSSSPDTDIGARLVALAGVGQGVRPDITDCMGLPLQVRDATQMVVWTTPDMFRVKVWGDGIIVARARNGTIHVQEIVYPSGAPFYEVYLSDRKRYERYCVEFGLRRIVTVTNEAEGIHYVEESDTYDPYCFDFFFHDYDLVLVGSDGWLTGQRPVESATSRTFEPVPLREVLQELTAFKSMTGEFIQRRCRRMLETYARKGWHFNDDVSLAGIYVENGDG